jgi:hypothetical protein
MARHVARAWFTAVFITAAGGSCGGEPNELTKQDEHDTTPKGGRDGESTTVEIDGEVVEDADDPAKASLDAGAKPTRPRDSGAARVDASTPAAHDDSEDAAVLSTDGGRIAAGDGGTPVSSSGSILPPVDKFDGMTNGPFAVTIEKMVGPNRGWVFRPTELGKDGLKHPIFTWGAGAGTNASNYEFHMSQIASHGFVVEAHASNGMGTDHKGAIDWLLDQNGKSGTPYFNKLDPMRIASGGHSQGSISTFAMADDPRLSTTIHVAGGSFDGNGYSNLRKPAAMFLGKDDTLATPNGQTDYMKSMVPTFMTVMDGVDHIQAARQALGPTIAWLRWHVAGEETQQKARFIGANCEFCKGKYKSMSKGF